MRLLSIESTAKAASVALTEGGKLIAQYFQNSALTHSRTLLKMAEDMLSNLELTLNDIDAIAVAIGPGSFTGVRIGISVAKGLCWGGNKPCYGVSTLEAMAYHLVDREDVIICSVMDARRNQIYNAKFTSQGGELLRLCPDRAISVDELISEAKADGKKYFFVGDGASLCYNAFEQSGTCCGIVIDPLTHQTAWGVAMAAERTSPVPAEDIIPNYLRLSQAERERLERLSKENSK